MKLFPLIRFIACSIILVLTVQFYGLAQQANWTHFRGNNLNGISDATNIPVSWNDSTNVIWKAAIDGKGWSSPVVYENQIWVTTATEDGKQMKAVCVDFNTGKTIFDKKLFEPDTVFAKHGVNTYATPTPCIEKDFVYAHFGSYGTACLKTSDASVVWQRSDLKCDHVQGPGSSPIIYNDLLILHYEGSDVQYIVALDKKTGKTIWKADRPKEYYNLLQPIGKKAYITPIVVNVNGQGLLISNGSAVCIAYNPETGQEVWRIPQGEDSTIAMPFTENGVVYFFTSFVSPAEGEKYAELLAVNPDGKGDISKTNILWRIKFPILQMLTPVIKDGLIYCIDTKGNLACIESKTGTIVKSRKLKGNYNSSPVYAAGYIYFSSTKGETLVIKAGKDLETIAQNKLDGEIWATPAIVNNSMLMRTSKFLYCIGMKKLPQ